MGILQAGPTLDGRFIFLRDHEQQSLRPDCHLIPQSWMQLPDHRTRYREHGFDVVHEENVTGSPADLRVL